MTRLADAAPDSQDLLQRAKDLEDEALNLFLSGGEPVLPLTDAMMDNALNLRKVVAYSIRKN